MKNSEIYFWFGGATGALIAFITSVLSTGHCGVTSFGMAMFGLSAGFLGAAVASHYTSGYD